MGSLTRRMVLLFLSAVLAIGLVPSLAFGGEPSGAIRDASSEGARVGQESVVSDPSAGLPLPSLLSEGSGLQSSGASLRDVALYELDGSVKELNVDYAGEPRVIIVGRPTCSNTKNMVQQALELSKDPGLSSIRFLVLDIDDKYREFLSGFGSMQTDRVRFASAPGNETSYYTWAWSMWRQAGSGGNTIAIPFTFIADESGQVKAATEGPQHLGTLIKDHLGMEGESTATATVGIAGNDDQVEARKLLAMVNEARAAVGAGTLRWNAALEAAARQRAAELSVLYSHTRPNGSSCFTAFPTHAASGENIAYGQMSAAEVNDGWTNSPGHYANMVNASFNSMATACFEGSDGTLYWVELFSGDPGSDGYDTAPDGPVVRQVEVLKKDVNLSMNGATVSVGQSKTLQVQAGRNADATSDSFAWTSSDPSTVSVSATGVVTGVRAGEVVITAALKSDASVSAQARVTCEGSSPDPGPTPDPDPAPDPGPDPTPDPDPGPDPVPDPGPTPDPTPDPDPAPDPAPTPEPAPAADRLFDPRPDGDAAGTSAAISAAAFPEGSEWVVVARDDDFADAMSATGLAGAVKAPIVLTGRFGLSESARREIERLGATRAYVVGGVGAMPGDFEGELAALGVSAERVFGSECWDTSVACAREIADHGGNARGEAVVAMSLNFQDALSISSFAYAYGVPIFLQTSEGERPLPPEAVEMVRALGGPVYVPGGTGAVRESTVEGVFGRERVVRMFGTTGYDTSNQIALRMVELGRLSPETVSVACGAEASKGSDALAGAALAGRRGGVLLLANGNEAMEPASVQTVEGFDSQGDPAFLSAHAEQVRDLYVLGGTFVMPDGLVARIERVLS